MTCQGACMQAVLIQEGHMSNDGVTDGGVVPALDMAAFFLSTNTKRWNLWWNNKEVAINWNVSCWDGRQAMRGALKTFRKFTVNDYHEPCQAHVKG